MEAVFASPAQEIDDRRVALNFGIASVGAVLKCAAYNLCGRIPDRLTDQTFDFTRKRAEHYDHFSLFPEHVTPTENLTDPAQFWREAEAMERQANGQVSRQVLFGIPRGLPVEYHRDYIAHVFKPLIDAGMAVHFDCHNAISRDGGENRHVHALLTMRRMNPDGTFDRKKARDWNALFTAGRGKVMRAQFEDRGNRWLEENGYNIRLRIRSNEELDGPDALPPEPSVRRADIEHTKRHPDDPAPAIISLDNHRHLRRQARHSQRAVAGLSAEIVRIEAARQRLPERGAHTMAKKIKTGWMAGADGYAALPDNLKASARRSYDRWKARQVEEGKKAGDIFGLSDYIDYVQGRRRDDRGWRFERPDDEANAIRRAPAPEIADSDAPPAPQPEQDDPDDMPEADGWDRESRFRARLLAGHYKISESSLTPEQVAAISKIRIDRNRGVATIELNTGDVFEDFGDRIVSPRDPSPETAAQLARAAALHGWSNVQLTGTPAYRDEMAIALSLLEPPVSHDWKLSREAQKRLDEALEARQQAFDSTNAIRPVDAPANEIVPEASPSRVVALDEPEDPRPADTDDGYEPDADPDFVPVGPDPIDYGEAWEAEKLAALEAREQAEEITTEDLLKLEQEPPPPTVRVPAVVLKTGDAVSVEWLQANRDAFAGMSEAEIMAQFPSFVGEQVNPAAFENDPSGGEDFDHATQEAEAVWNRQVGEAVEAWEEATGRELADLPHVECRQVFITDPADPAGDLDAADMRTRPELAKVADRLKKLTNEQLEKRLSQTFPHYHPDVGAPDARDHAVAEWKARRAAKKEANNAKNQNGHEARVPGHDGAVSHAIPDPAPGPDGGNAGADVADVRQQRTAGNGADAVRDSRPDGLRPAPDEQSGEQVIRQTLAEIRERYDREAARLDVPALTALLEPRQAAIDAAIKAAERTASKAAKEAKAARNAASFLSPGTRKAADDAEKRAQTLKAEADRLKESRQDAMRQARKDAEAERRELTTESERQARSPEYRQAECALRDANLIDLALSSRDAGTLEALKTGDFSAIRAAAQDWQREQQRQADAMEVTRLKAGPKAKQAQKSGLSVIPE
ncbi:MobA/MobL family protein [Gluconobacter sp. P1C6_b]|uniref:MobA/MobL family protein n=1 Tax=Gluconobacter sp. P1C6_b TaxID=2762619 RepID=UPI001C04A43F|nr:MobA/MobL family protein [Gluconobacter sp. P1C6_b]